MADDDDPREREDIKGWERVGLPVSMVVIQLITVGMTLLSKLALNAGMSPFIIIVYRNLIAAAAVAPLAFCYER